MRVMASGRFSPAMCLRIPANHSLERDIAELLRRPVGRPSQKPLVEYKRFLYQAASWKTARRVVAKVEHIVLGGLDWGQTGVYSKPPEVQKTNSG
jgi:hypothetical protein